MKISIVIPTYECHGRGVEFLKRNLDSIYSQTFKDYEVIVSDHSVSYRIQEFCDNYDNIPVVYTRNAFDRGNSSANLNNAIRQSVGEIIKPMCQDDFIYDDNCLQIIHDHIVGGEKWVVVGNNSYTDEGAYFKEHIPTWNDDIIIGVNTLSSPSCMAYLWCDDMWDERLIWLMDCEFYYKLFKKYGLPYLESKILVTNFGHEFQYTHLIDNDRKKQEVSLMRKEHGYKDE